MKFIKTFNKLNKTEISIAGNKGVNLGEMIRIRVPVPPGFVVLTRAFERFLEETDISAKIHRMWYSRINIDDIKLVEEKSEILKTLILKMKMPIKIEKEILEAFKKLKVKYVAVRSSANAEDSKIDSWAGVLETYLNTTKENLIENVKKCWASLYTPRVIFYRFKKNLNRKSISVAVVIQKMIQSEVSGVCFTIHPVTKNRNQIVIEAVFGLRDTLVQGEITPDIYMIEKSNLKILDINRNSQNKMIIGSKRGTKTVFVPKVKKERQKLSENQIKKLVKIFLKIENYYKEPQNIEWALEKNKFYILQTRPITSL